MRRNGFTRLEAGIILSAALVTVTLLVPVMAQARANWLQNQRKNQFQCMNNLKTIGMSILLYNQDYDEWHPPVAAHEPRAHGWADLLYPDYVKDRTAFQCPSEKNDRSDNPKQAGYTDYWYNSNFSGKNIYVIDAENWTPQPVAQTIMLGDGDGGYATSSARYSINTLPKIWDKTANSPVKRHLGGANYAFADGHVKWLRPHQITSSAGSDSKNEVYSFKIPSPK